MKPLRSYPIISEPSGDTTKSRSVLYTCSICQESQIKDKPGRKTAYICRPCALAHTFERERRRQGSHQLKKELIKERGDACERCGATGNVMMHHKTSISWGGANSKENCELLCQSCHQKEHGHGVGSATN